MWGRAGACAGMVLVAGCVGAPVGPWAGQAARPYPAYGYGGAAPGYYPGAPYYPPLAAPAPPRQAVRTRPRPAPATVAARVPEVAAPAAAPSAAVSPPPAVSAVPAAAGPECRTVTELGYREGREVRQDQRYCRTPPGRDWVRS